MLTPDFSTMNRRHFMRHMAGFSAMALPGLGFVQKIAQAAPAMKKDSKSIIVLWMSGGPPTIDIWDLKPGEQTGGEFKQIKTSAPGVEISEHMPMVAKQMKHLAVVRSLVTNEGDHNRGRTLMHTSHTPSPIITYPSIGAVASYQLAEQKKELSLPHFIAVGRPADGPGFLGMNYAPFTVQNPGQPPANIRPPESVGNDMDRIRRRQRLFYSVEDTFKDGLNPHMSAAEKKAQADAAKAHSDIYKKAFDLVASPLGKVFDLAGEKASTRQKYGNNGFGNGCLMARRLIEQGVTCVEVDLGGWDLHANVFNTLKTQRLPMLDRGMGALVEDLVERGMWKNTTLVWMGEFGRTPRINQNVGRDHWARCWSVVVGGGAIKGGQVFGATDKDGTSVADSSPTATIKDVFATLYKGIGLDPATPMRDNLGRPMPIADGKPLAGLV
jgi:uncharacterized protein (DUF1501 family)